MEHGVKMVSSVKRGMSCLTGMHCVREQLQLDGLSEWTGIVVLYNSDDAEPRVVVTSENWFLFIS